MSGPQLVSVVIPVFNGAPFIGEAVASVRAQRHQPVEVIVVDDGSTDGSAEVARALCPDRLTVLAANRGPSTARNIGIAQASGEYITFLDADDTMLPARVHSQVRHLVAQPDASAVVGRQKIIVEPGVTPPRWLESHPEAMGDEGWLQITAMASTQTMLEVGGFEPGLRMSEDMEWLFRLDRRGSGVSQLDETLVRRRIHGANATYRTEEMHRTLLQAARSMMPFREPPRVSVVVPAHNAARYLAEALESALGQEHDGRLQIIVIDDGSSDDTAAVARGYEPDVEVVQQPRLGPGVARNHGILLARGGYLAFLDADDIWVPGKLTSQLAALEASDEVDLVFGHTEEFVSPELTSMVTAARRARPVTAGHLPSAMMIRRSSLARVGPFCVNRERPEWLEWYSRAQEVPLHMGVVDRLVLRRRLHGSNHSAPERMARSTYLTVVTKALERRRRAEASE